MVEICEKFLSMMKNQKLYLVEFEENGSMKAKYYPDDYIIKKDLYYSLIVITHNEYIFLANRLK